MNRYSFVFALLLASSFAVRAPQTADVGATQRTASTPEKNRSAQQKTTRPPVQLDAGDPNGPIAFIRDFLDKHFPGQLSADQPKVLFVTVPHPLETHLAASFDYKLDGLQDGLAQSGYLFDSSWIPWSAHPPRERFEDDDKEKLARSKEDDYPGILLFRNNNNESRSNPYINGLVVFLITEKPTQGLAVRQAQTACAILQALSFQLTSPLQIIGPSYSGSFASMVSVVRTIGESRLLAGANTNGKRAAVQEPPKVIIRSGSVTVSDAAQRAVKEIGKLLQGFRVDFGSTSYDDSEWFRAVCKTLMPMKIDMNEVAILSEEQSLYGATLRKPKEPTKPAEHMERKETKDDSECEAANQQMWQLGFPRDISSLRASYQNQGIFATASPFEPWKRTLEIKPEESGEGDSIKSFGGSSTIAVQEGVLLGISQFLRTHHTRVVVITATNPEDRFFLAQFLHAHNGNVRIVVLGATRTFMRSSTAEFRGDLIVDSFPLLPRLTDWTGQRDPAAVHIFGDSTAQGMYFSAIDLFYKAPSEDSEQSSSLKSQSSGILRHFPEYSEPTWEQKQDPVRRPSMYVLAMGTHFTWSLNEC